MKKDNGMSPAERAAAGRKGKKRSAWGRNPMVPRRENYRRLREWKDAD